MENYTNKLKITKGLFFSVYTIYCYRERRSRTLVSTSSFRNWLPYCWKDACWFEARVVSIYGAFVWWHTYQSPTLILRRLLVARLFETCLVCSNCRRGRPCLRRVCVCVWEKNVCCCCRKTHLYI